MAMRSAKLFNVRTGTAIIGWYSLRPLRHYWLLSLHHHPRESVVPGHLHRGAKVKIQTHASTSQGSQVVSHPNTIQNKRFTTCIDLAKLPQKLNPTSTYYEMTCLCGRRVSV